ncbi:MAG: hypothetical protein ACYS0E_05425 [Planctomycetota bacterium]
MQDFAALTLVALAVGYLGWRYLSRRATGNCCGEKECPAAREMVEKLQRGTR